jgi:YVTN family beta-propeller protein
MPDSAEVLATIPVSVRPRRIGITPDGARAYVTMDDFGAGSAEPSGVAVIDTATNTVVTTIEVGARPSAALCSPDGRHVYVPNWAKDTSGRPGVLSVIATDTNTVVATVELSSNAAIPSGGAMTPDGRAVYVACEKEPLAPDSDPGSVAVVDTATNTVKATLTGNQRPDSVTATPDGAFVYVLDFDGDPQVIETATNTATNPWFNIMGSGRIAFTADGSHLYYANDGQDFVTVLDVATHQAVAAVDVNGGHCTDIARTPDGRHICISERSGEGVPRQLQVVDIATNKIIGSPAKWDGSSDGLAIAPDGSKAYVSDRRKSAVRVIQL